LDSPKLEDTDLNEQQATITKQGIMTKLAFCEDILKEKKRPLDCQTSWFDFFNSSSGTRALPSLLLGTGENYPKDQSTE
jgi:hypothetical protein